MLYASTLCCGKLNFFVYNDDVENAGFAKPVLSTVTNCQGILSSAFHLQ